ncbi:zinc metalloproteinase dpy-31-like [Argopecten irradians]|uniref:zinc metalloproteinase dpy-31-like n=1 Tax=Argopecten irradians TaxID=31199 RepID=UPI00371FEF88
MNYLNVYLWSVLALRFGIFTSLMEISEEFPLYDSRHNLTGEEYDPEDAKYVRTDVVRARLWPSIENGGFQTQPLSIQDGQSLIDKLRVMRALAGIERRMEELHGLKQSEHRNLFSTVNYVYEMDIILTPSQAETIYEHGKIRQKRKMSASITSLWEMPIYYYYGGEHTPETEQNVESVIAEWSNLTCLNFSRASGPVTWEQGNKNNVTIEFTPNGCWSYVGKKENANNVQKVSVDGCVYRGRIAHELGHVIGFWHEQARPDRDDHVIIEAPNIMDNKHGDFVKLTWQDINSNGIPYDVGSVMHYGSTAFSKAGNPTVVARKSNLQRALGQRHGLSFYDIKLANLVYCSDCCNNSQLAQPCKNGGYQDPKICTRCRCPEGLSGTFCETAAPAVGLSCGGDVNVTSTVMTIGHAQGFQDGDQCNWYLKAPPGMNVHFDLVGDFINFGTCYKDHFVTCDSFMEVRYSSDLANTGARYCCSLKEDPSPLVSESSDMVVLLRGHNSGSVGFQANVWAEPCGGCSVLNMTSIASKYQPCYSSVSKTCRKTWKKKQWVPCKKSWFTPRSNTNCNRYVMVDMSRDETCIVSVPSCCNNYRLEGSYCVAQSTAKDDDLSSSDMPAAPSPGNDDNSTKQGSNDVMSWSTWSPCSKTCGGCGNKTRHRECSNPDACGGDDQEEIEGCAAKPCDTPVMTTCTRTVAVKGFCPPWSTNTCTKYHTETYTCPDPTMMCCKGYVLQGGLCVPVNT